MITLVNTRPAHQATLLTRALEAAGYAVLEWPTLLIEYIPFAIPSFSKVSILIFTSANAVTALQRHGDIPLSTICLAIGEGTADAMEKAGIPVAARPTLFSSEGLLELPELQHVDQQSIAIITGENSRGLLKKALIQRGAKVKEYGVYRRQCPVVTPEQIKQLIQTSIHAIIITSQESLSNLIHMLGEKNCPWLFQQSLLVIHPKIEAYAREMGFQNTIGVAKNPTAKALLDELKI